ncbi:uncharacterized protein LOC133175059 isoform X2 [Saccostrea echinata]|uniref:uncharacterized protein LOC133175059 isoform X2 n=1 Tax=Saccostrea echinata TaxID=191078 RepID=UPI002A7F2BB0|nr:uncharacterized protein LOC133175059 isoform X2 [Saccostrea echinata]
MFVSALILWTALSYGALASLDRCPSVFNRVGGYKTENGEMCYTFVNTEKTWVDANSQCWAWGGELISIKNWNKMSFVIHTLNSVLRWRNNGVWIGAHDRHGRGWQWTNGERLTWGYWASGQPSKTGGFISLEDCALMRRGDGWRWHDYHCDSSFFFTYKFICQFHKLNQGEGSVSSVVGGESESDSTGSDTGILAGIIVGGAILILIGAIGTLLLRRRRQKKFEEPSVQFQNLAYSRVSNSGQDGNVASNVYMDTNEMNRLYEEVNKQVNHGVNCFSGTVLDIQVPRSDSGDHQENACCGGMSEESDLKKLNNLTHVAIPPDTKNPPDTTENHYVDMSTANKAKETNRLVEASRVVDPSKPSNLGVDREPMPLPVYANSLENLREGTLELTSTLSSQSKESTYMNRQEGFEVDEDGYMSPRSTLHSDSDTELMGADKDPLYDEIR